MNTTHDTPASAIQFTSKNDKLAITVIASNIDVLCYAIASERTVKLKTLPHRARQSH